MPRVSGTALRYVLLLSRFEHALAFHLAGEILGGFHPGNPQSYRFVIGVHGLGTESFVLPYAVARFFSSVADGCDWTVSSCAPAFSQTFTGS